MEEQKVITPDVEKQLAIDTEEGTLEERDVVKPMTKSGILAAISSAIAAGNLPSHAARQLRLQVGVTQGDFTRKQTSKDKRKSKRKMQKKSRRKNRNSK